MTILLKSYSILWELEINQICHYIFHHQFLKSNFPYLICYFQTFQPENVSSKLLKLVEHIELECLSLQTISFLLEWIFLNFVSNNSIINFYMESINCAVLMMTHIHSFFADVSSPSRSEAGEQVSELAAAPSSPEPVGRKIAFQTKGMRRRLRKKRPSKKQQTPAVTRSGHYIPISSGCKKYQCLKARGT